MNAAASPRHAVYFAPAPEHPLWAAGCAWLGRDPIEAGAPRAAPRAELVAPWRYGFHATLKAPMRLAQGVDEANWLAAVASLASRHAAFTLPALQVATLADFLALRPIVEVSPDHPLRRIADECVLLLDPWRAPPSDEERARRHDPSLGARQRSQLEHHGYAHVLDDWRFHLTLTGSLAGMAPGHVAELRAAAQRHFAAALAEPLRFDALSVFVEPARGAPFELRHRFPLARS